MKRHGNLWEKLISKENFELAYKRATKGKRGKKAIIKFNKDKDANLEAIRQSVINKTFTTAPYSMKKIYEPKERNIYILPFSPDRIVQHALMNILIPIYEKLFIRDSYACINGRGIHSASARTMEFMRKRENNFCLKCDVAKFYPSIPQDRMKAILRRKIKDRDVLWLADDIIQSFPGDRNIPIGNFCSQWFGNLYLNELDGFVKGRLKCRNYLRYCDDFVLFANSRETAHSWALALGPFMLRHLGLRLRRSDLVPVSRGLDFVGYHHFRYHVLLRKSTARRVSRRLPARLRRYRAGTLDFLSLQSSLASVTGWFRWASTHNLSRKLGLEPMARFVDAERHRLKLPPCLPPPGLSS